MCLSPHQETNADYLDMYALFVIMGGLGFLVFFNNLQEHRVPAMNKYELPLCFQLQWIGLCRLISKL